MSTSTSVIFGFDCTSNTQMLFAKPTNQLHLIIVKFLLMSLGGTEKKDLNTLLIRIKKFNQYTNFFFY